MKYAIADYLNDSQKRRAIDAKYIGPAKWKPNTLTPEQDGTYAESMRTFEKSWVNETHEYVTANRCPLAVALDLHGAVGGKQVAQALWPESSPKQQDIFRAANHFIHAWDHGEITNLAEALGTAV